MENETKNYLILAIVFIICFCAFVFGAVQCNQTDQNLKIKMAEQGYEQSGPFWVKRK